MSVFFVLRHRACIVCSQPNHVVSFCKTDVTFAKATLKNLTNRHNSLHRSVITGILRLFNPYLLKTEPLAPIEFKKIGVAVVAGQMGIFPRAKELRNKAGLDLSTLVAKLGAEGPKERSIRKLEEGNPIRLAGAYRVGHVINASLKERGSPTVDLDAEIRSV